MPSFADRAKETTTSTGTGAITLSGTAASTFQTLQAAFGSQVRLNVGYCIAHQSANEWEVGKGTFNGTTGLTRDVVRSGSSGTGVLVNFSAGTKDVFVAASAEHVDNANHGQQYAMARNIVQP